MWNCVYYCTVCGRGVQTGDKNIAWKKYDWVQITIYNSTTTKNNSNAKQNQFLYNGVKL